MRVPFENLEFGVIGKGLPREPALDARREVDVTSGPVVTFTRDDLPIDRARGSTARANLGGLHAAAALGDPAAVRRQLAGGAEPSALCPAGWAPLHLAAAAGDARVVQLLLFAGAPVDQASAAGNGATALHCAAAGGHAEVVRVLLCAGAGVDRPDGAGFTALHLAAAAGCPAVIAALARSGADPLVAVVGRTALALARRARHHDAVALLRQIEGCARPHRRGSFTGW